MYDILGYFVSAIILCGLVAFTYKVSDYFSSKIVDFFDTQKEKIEEKKDKVEKKTIETRKASIDLNNIQVEVEIPKKSRLSIDLNKVFKEKKSNDELEKMINSLTENQAKANSIDKLISKINLLEHSEIIATLEIIDSDKLNKLKHLLRNFHKNKESFFKSNILYVIVGAVFGEGTKGIVRGAIIDNFAGKGDKDTILCVGILFILTLVVSIIISLIIKVFNGNKKIELDSEYLISKIDLVIENKNKK